MIIVDMKHQPIKVGDEVVVSMSVGRHPQLRIGHVEAINEDKLNLKVKWSAGGYYWLHDKATTISRGCIDSNKGWYIMTNVLILKTSGEVTCHG